MLKFAGKPFLLRDKLWMSLFLAMIVLGLADLLLLAIQGHNYLNWFNDLLVIFGGVKLVIVNLMAIMEREV